MPPRELAGRLAALGNNIQLTWYQRRACGQVAEAVLSGQSVLVHRQFLALAIKCLMPDLPRVACMHSEDDGTYVTLEPAITCTGKAHIESGELCRSRSGHHAHGLSMDLAPFMQRPW